MGVATRAERRGRASAARADYLPDLPAGMLAPRAYTSGEVAGICGVAPRTVALWVDRGLLRGHRLPGSLDRRVYAADLYAFMAAHGMRLPPALAGAALAVGYLLGEGESVPGGEHPADAFALGELAASSPVACLVVGDAAGSHAAKAAAEFVLARHPRCRVVLVAGEDAAGPEWPGAWRVLRRPVAWGSVLFAAGLARGESLSGAV